MEELDGKDNPMVIDNKYAIYYDNMQDVRNYYGIYKGKTGTQNENLKFTDCVFYRTQPNGINTISMQILRPYDSVKIIPMTGGFRRKNYQKKSKKLYYNIHRSGRTSKRMRTSKKHYGSSRRLKHSKRRRF